MVEDGGNEREKKGRMSIKIYGVDYMRVAGPKKACPLAERSSACSALADVHLSEPS